MALSENGVDCLNSKLSHSPKDCADTSEETPSGIGLDIDEEIVHGMTVSYTEISFNTQSSEPDDSVLEDLHDSIQEVERLHEGSKSIEDAAERPSQLQLSNDDPVHSLSQSSSTNRAIEFLNHLNGTVTQDGPMVSYVAEDLETKIKLSSPVTKSDDLNVWGSGMPWLYRQVLTSQITSVDLSILTDLEIEVGKIATSVDSLTENLAGILHSMSALTVECLETYRDVVCKTCDAVDLNIKSMYQLMAKCEELSKSMTPIYKLSEHIKEIKHFLDVFENTMS